VKVFVADEEGREMVLAEQGPGEFFGEISLDNGPRCASVTTIEPSRLVVIPRAEFRTFCASHPGMAMMLVNHLIQRVRHLTQNVKNLALVDVYGRVARLIVDLARDKDGKRVIDPRPTQQDMAVRVGASREMISRILKDLAAGGYIRIEGAQLIIEREPPAAW
jgi:CRP/FNR family transcriptional regulator, cyclic AMP receptor protein